MMKAYSTAANPIAPSNEHAAGDKHEKSTMSLAEAATEARENSMALNHSKGNHDDSGSDIGNSRPIDHEYPISH